jgi:hypothetical protein
MSDTLGLLLTIAVAAVFFPLLWRHARETDRLEDAYRNRIRERHPTIRLERKRGAVQYLLIDGVVYPSSVVDFRSRYKKSPAQLDGIIDEYLASVPTRYRHLGRGQRGGLTTGCS